MLRSHLARQYRTKSFRVLMAWNTPAADRVWRHRHTQVFEVPVRRMISLVPTPSLVSSTISARHACFCAALRSLMIRSSRSLSDGERLIEIPLRIQPDSHNRHAPGIHHRTLPSDFVH